MHFGKIPNLRCPFKEVFISGDPFTQCHPPAHLWLQLIISIERTSSLYSFKKKTNMDCLIFHLVWAIFSPSLDSDQKNGQNHEKHPVVGQGREIVERQDNKLQLILDFYS